MWKLMPGFFTPGAPLYNEEGGDIIKGPRNLDAAKRLLAASGYAGQPVALSAAQDIANLKAWGEVTVDLLTRIGMKVDFAAVDWGTLMARRAQKAPPAQGGWNIYQASLLGEDCLDPSNKMLRANGEVGSSGWPTAPEVEAEIAAWYRARTFEEEKSIARRLNKVALDNVVYAPVGFYLRYQAWRRNVSGVGQGPMPLFWDVSKSV